MTARETLTELAEFFEDDLTIEVATVARGARGGPPELRTLLLAGDAEEYFQGVIQTRVADQLDPMTWSVKKLDPTYKADPDDLEWQRLDELDPVTYAIGRLDNMSAIGPFDDGDDAYKRRLSYWAAALTHPDGRQAYFFRAVGPSAELQRKRGAALVSRHGTFSIVDDTIFVFDDRIDCFAYGEYVFVVRKNEFRRIFDQLEAVLRRAKRAAQDLHARVPIANYVDFEQACASDSRLADKVLAVRKRDYFDQLSYEMLEPVIAEFSLGIPTRRVGGETQLVFGTGPDQRFRILKLVDDDYLRSSMTDHRYEVNSKTDPPSP